VRDMDRPRDMPCNDPTHDEWYHKYSRRFIRLSYPGGHIVIRRQQALTLVYKGAVEERIKQKELGLPGESWNRCYNTY